MRDNANSSAESSKSLTAAQRLAEAASKEFFWGCELTKDKNSVQWTFEEEEDDQDFLQHTLFLRHAVLGSTATKDERNIVEIETTNFAGETVKQPIFSLTAGSTDMCPLDLNFGHEIPVTFRLAAGSGPLYISAQQLVEFPPELDESDFTATETEIDTEDDVLEDVKIMGKKRKAPTTDGGKRKRGKLDNASGKKADDDDDEEDEEEDDEDEEDHDEDDDEENEESMEAEEEDEDEDEDDEDEDEDEEIESPEPKKKGKGKAKPVVKAMKNGKAKAAPPKGKRAKKVK